MGHVERQGARIRVTLMRRMSRADAILLIGSASGGADEDKQQQTERFDKSQ